MKQTVYLCSDRGNLVTSHMIKNMPVSMHPKITFAASAITILMLPVLMDSQLSPYVFFTPCPHRNFQMSQPQWTWHQRSEVKCHPDQVP